MLLIIKKNKYIWIIPAIIIFAIVVGTKIDQLSTVITSLLDKAGASVGSSVNRYMAYAILAILPFMPFIVWRLQCSSLIAFAIILIPFLSRSNGLYEIYLYTGFEGTPHYAYGIVLVTPLVFLYLLFRFPKNQSFQNWRSNSSKAFLVLAASGIMTQFAFHPIISAVGIAYLVMGFHLIWYFIILRFVNSYEEVLKIVWTIIISVALGSILTMYTTGINPSGSTDRLESLVFGANNYYTPLLASTLCLLPALLFQKNISIIGKFVVIVIALLVGRELLLTGTRGGYLGVLLILGYLWFFRNKKLEFIVMIFFLFVTFVFKDHLLSLFGYRFDESNLQDSFLVRSEKFLNAFYALLSWPYFITGYGFYTETNLVPKAHEVHNGFLWVWVTTGFTGFLGFCFWIYYVIANTIRNLIKHTNYNQKLIVFGLMLSIGAWIIAFITTGGWYSGSSAPQTYAFFTIEMGLLVTLTQKSGSKIDSYANVGVDDK